MSWIGAVIYSPFITSEHSHAHSRETLDLLYEYDDFMQSVRSMIDMGCGTGLDLEWWATRTTRDERQTPLDIQCTGIDLRTSLSLGKKYKNIRYYSQDFEQPILANSRQFDVIWCHDSFQCVLDPFRTLRQWRDVTNPDGMLVLIIPQSTNVESRTQAFDQRDGCYWHWTMVNLIHVLAVTGWDCAAGFFRKNPQDPWLHAVVYRSEKEPRDPKSVTWYELAEQGLLPESAQKSVERWGYLRQRDLVLPWLDKSRVSMHNH